jgi:hypothetical protein
VTDQGFYRVSGGTEGGDTHLWPEINGRSSATSATDRAFVEAVRTGQPFVQDWREAPRSRSSTRSPVGAAGGW